MAGVSTLSRLRVRRQAANPLNIPYCPKYPEAIKSRLSQVRQDFERLDNEWERWRQKVQYVLEQSIMALKLDPGNSTGGSMCTCQCDTEAIKREIIAYVDSRYATLKFLIDSLRYDFQEHTGPTPEVAPSYLTAAQMQSCFAKFINLAGETITLSSSGGEFQRIIGCNDDGTPQDDVTPYSSPPSVVSIPPIGATYYTADQMDAAFIRFINSAGSTLTLTSPSGLYQRIIGCNDDGTAQDDIAVSTPFTFTVPPSAGDVVYLTAEEVMARYLRFINSTGNTLTLISPDGTHQRILGCHISGLPQDDLI